MVRNVLINFALLLFAGIGLSLCAVGLIYLVSEEFIPYHSAAIQADWSELGQNEHGLILGLIKGLGSGALIAGSAAVYMAVASMRRSPAPYVTLLPLVAVGHSGLLCYATFFVATSTPGNPPLLPTAGLAGLGVLATGLLPLTRRRSNES